MKSIPQRLIVASMVLALAAPVAAQAPDGAAARPGGKGKKSLLSRAQMLQYKGEHEEAIALYREAAALAPGDLGTTLLLSGALLQRDRVQQARQAWDLWMKHSKQRGRLKLAAEHLLARLVRDHKDREAEAVCDAWLEKLQTRDRFAVLGDVYWKVGDNLRAVQLYTLQLALAPSSPRLARRVEAWNLGAGLKRAAVEALRLYLRQSPADLDVTRRLVALLARQKRTGEIEGTWKLWLASSRRGRRHAVVGDYFHGAGQPERAAAYYTKHVGLDPSDMAAVRYLARRAEEAGKKDRVIQLFKDAVKDRPATNVVREAAVTMLRLGRPGEAEQAWLYWYKRSGDSQKDLILARFYQETKNAGRALEHLRKHVARFPGNSAGVKVLATELVARGQKKAVAAVVDRFIKKQRQGSRGHSQAAEIYLDAGDPRAARKHYLKYMRSSGDDRYRLRSFTRKAADKGHHKLARELWTEYCRTSKQGSRHEHAGDFFSSVNRPREAVAHYAKHLKIEPDDTWVIRQLARMLGQTGRRAEADRVWNNYITNGSDSRRFERAGDYYYRAGKIKRALKLYQRHLQINPQDVQAHRAVADAMVRAGQIKAAAALWEGAIVSLTSRSRFEEAARFFRTNGRVDRALELYRKHLQENPQRVSAYRVLARTLQEVGKVNEGVALWDSGVKTLTDNSRYSAAGEFYKRARRWKRAVSVFTRDIKLNPKSLSAYRSLAEALHETNKTAQAVALWERGVRVLTDYYRFQRAGDFFKRVGLTSRALEMYRKHFETRSSRWACVTYTRALVEAGKVEEALAVWEKAVTTLRDSHRYDAAGDFLRNNGWPARALIMYRKHLALNPHNVGAHRAVSRALVSAGKVKEAVALWEKALKTLTGSDRFQRAGDFYKSIGRYDEAVKLHRKYLEVTPGNVWSYHSLAEVLRMAGRDKEAIAVWQRAMRTHPTEHCYRTAGNFFRNSGRLDLAIATSRKRLKAYPGDLSAHDMLAGFLRQAGKEKQAVTLWEKATRTLATSDRYRRAGHFYRSLGRWDRAATMYRKHLVLRPGDLSSREYLARALVHQGKTGQAVALWEKGVLTLGDKYRYQRAGEFFSHVGRWDRAAAMHRKFLSLDPSSSSGYLQLARALRAAGKIKEAVAVWDKATNQLNDPYRYSRAGGFFKELGRWDRAAKMYRKHMAVRPSDSSTRRQLAGVLLSAGKVKEATALWEKMVKDTTDSYRFSSAGIFYNSIERPARAVEMFRLHLKRQPNNRWGHDALALQLLRMGRSKQAAAVWDARIKSGHDPDRFAPAGKLHHRLGNHDRAVELLRKHLRARPTYTWAVEYLANALAGAGKIPEAEKLWQRWLRTGGSSQLSVAAAWFMRVGKVGKALTLYRKHLAQQPTSCHSYRQLAAALTSAGKTADGEKVWALGLKRCAPGSKKMAADYYRQTGRAARAIPLYGAHLRSLPLDQTAVEALVGALIMEGRVVEAAAALRAATPKMRPEFLGTVGLFHGRIGKLKEAIGLLEKLVAAHPGTDRGHRLLAGAYLRAGKKDRAVAVWRKGLPRCGGCSATAAEFYQSIGQCTEAVPLYRKALASDHRNIPLHSQLAHCLELLGKPAEAKKERAVAASMAVVAEGMAPTMRWTYQGRNSAHASALNSAAWLYLTHDSFKARRKHALALARRAVAISPFNGHLLGTLVIALCRNGQGAEALRLAKRRLAWAPLSDWGHMEKALAHFTLGQRDLARKHLKRSHELHLVPDPDLAREQKALAASLKAAP